MEEALKRELIEEKIRDEVNDNKDEAKRQWIKDNINDLREEFCESFFPQEFKEHCDAAYNQSQE